MPFQRLRLHLHAQMAALLVAGASARAHDTSDEILVGTTSQLVAAMNPANAGRTIRIQAGVYCPNAPLTLPEGSEVVGAGIMENEGSPQMGFREATATEIVPADGGARCPPELGSFAGTSVLNLTDGSSLRGVKVTIDAPRHTFPGNTVVILAKGAQKIRTSMSECDIQARSGNLSPSPGVPGGRALSIMTGDAPPYHDLPGDPRIDVSVSRSVIRGNSPLGPAVFTSHYESRAQTSIFFHANVFTEVGGASLDLVGGISRSLFGVPSPVENTLTEILSIGNLYRGRGIGSTGWGFSAGATAGATDSTFNRMSFTSVGDRIENVGIGFNARAAVRRGVDHGHVHDNLLELHLIGTEISTIQSAVAADMVFCPIATPPAVNVVQVGDRNLIDVTASGLQGSGTRDNVFTYSPGRCGSIESLGTDNGTSFSGSLQRWNVQNDNIDPDPPADLFTREP